jgi:hypothetical protein
MLSQVLFTASCAEEFERAVCELPDASGEPPDSDGVFRGLPTIGRPPVGHAGRFRARDGSDAHRRNPWKAARSPR